MVEALAVIARLCQGLPFGGTNSNAQKAQRDCWVPIAECLNAKTNNGTDANRATNLIACVKAVP